MIERLVQMKGIGRWTAEMFLIFHLLRPDVLPVADIGIQKAIASHFNDGVRPGIVKLTLSERTYRSTSTNKKLRV